MAKLLQMPALLLALCCASAQGLAVAPPADAGAGAGTPDRTNAESGPIPAEQLLLVPEPLRRQLHERVRLHGDPARTLGMLADFLLKPEGLGLRYRHDATFSVAEAFARREGNCLTFTLLTVALARELGLKAYGQDADAVSWHQEGGSVYRTLHVNAGVRADGRRFSVDIASSQVITREAPRPISDARLFAHYYSNRAAEELSKGDPRAALAYAQQALDIDPAHAAALNNAGVIHARLGQSDAAERAYLAALRVDADHAGALFNLAELYARESRGALARDLQQRLQHTLERDPFHHFLLGLQQESAGDAHAALVHLRRAIRLHRHDHRFHFAQARAWARLGRFDRAERALQFARDLSEGEHKLRYQAKLEGLRRSGHSHAALPTRRPG